MFFISKEKKEQRLIEKIHKQYVQYLDMKPKRNDFPNDEVYELAYESWMLLAKSTYDAFHDLMLKPIETKDSYKFEYLSAMPVPFRLLNLDPEIMALIDDIKLQNISFDKYIHNIVSSKLNKVIKLQLKKKYLKPLIKFTEDHSTYLFNDKYFIYALLQYTYPNVTPSTITAYNAITDLKHRLTSTDTFIDLHIAEDFYQQHSEQFDYFCKKHSKALLIHKERKY